jgi:predicted Zn-dependent protease
MATTSRREQLEALLATDPQDPFLRYGLALEYESEGDTAGAVDQLLALIQDFPEYVPAFLQVGQLLIKLERIDEAKSMLSMGIQTAEKVGDPHAYSEMEGLLDSIS